MYLVGHSGTEDRDRPGRNNRITYCEVSPPDGQTRTYPVRVVRLDRLGLYGTKVDPTSAGSLAVTCNDATVTTGPIVALYDYTGLMEIFGFLFAVIGRIVGWPRDRPHFGKWNLGPR